MATRAKFVCGSVEKAVNHWINAGENKPFIYAARFSAVTEGTPEDKAFWQSSPSGQITLSSFLPDTFKPGQKYYVDFTEAE